MVQKLRLNQISLQRLNLFLNKIVDKNFQEEKDSGLAIKNYRKVCR